MAWTLPLALDPVRRRKWRGYNQKSCSHAMAGNCPETAVELHPQRRRKFSTQIFLRRTKKSLAIDCSSD
jgi:hypothetical protein